MRLAANAWMLFKWIKPFCEQASLSFAHSHTLSSLSPENSELMVSPIGNVARILGGEG